MKIMMVSVVALGAMTSVALAGEPANKSTPAKAAPFVLTEAQMDKVAAGQVNVGACVVCTNIAAALAANVLTSDSESTATTGDQSISIGTSQ